MELNVIGASPVKVSEAIFGAAFREDLVHQVVVAYRNAGRAGTKAQLNHARMSGTTKKFKKQKGGGARHGDYRAPIFVGGARAFAAQPRDFAQKVNRKMYRGAVGIVLDALDPAGHAFLVALEVDDAVVLLVPAATVAHGDAPEVVAATGLGLDFGQRRVGVALVQPCKGRHANHAAAAR
jgi:ribosomal protein L4